MDSQCWIIGGVVSVASHVLLLAVLFAVGSVGRQEVPEEAIPQAGESVRNEMPLALTAETPSAPAVSPVPAAETVAAVSPVSEYEVRAGDTLGAIARRIGCSVKRLAEVNGSDVKTLSCLKSAHGWFCQIDRGLVRRYNFVTCES